jgi:hypothetical protein
MVGMRGFTILRDRDRARQCTSSLTCWPRSQQAGIAEHSTSRPELSATSGNLGKASQRVRERISRGPAREQRMARGYHKRRLSLCKGRMRIRRKLWGIKSLVISTLCLPCQRPICSTRVEQCLSAQAFAAPALMSMISPSSTT